MPCATHADEAAVIDWIKQNAIVLQSVEAETGFDDLEPLRDIIGDAPNRRLGRINARHARNLPDEAPACSSSSWRRWVSPSSASRASYPDCIAINDYVLSGEGDPVVALNGQGFWTWDTEEVLDLIEWMRAYNENPDHEEKLLFYGYDMQNFTPAATYAIEALKAFDAEAAAEIETAVAPLLAPGSFQKYAELDDAQRERRSRRRARIWSRSSNMHAAP